MTAEEKKTSPWVWIGVGCLGAVVIAGGACATLLFLGYRQVREMSAAMEDPVARTGLAEDILVSDGLPDGYHAMAAFSIPFLMETAVLSDLQPDDDGQITGFDERGFIYVKTLSFGNQEQELRDFFEGTVDDPDLLRQSSIRVRSEELVRRGSIQDQGRTLRWVAHRGAVNVRGGAELEEGLTTMIMVDCDSDERLRLGIWFGPDPDPDSAAGELDVSGTVADESEIEAFMSSFDFCSR